ncbi:MAG: lipoprotein [Hyphomicrobiaceae bacterium]|nr:lipoprotein [Hyphomicrobiaceae bacterium]
MRSALAPVMAALLVTAVSLSACGRKGPLERPPAARAADGQAGETSDRGGPDRPFILDRLLR